MLCNRLTEHERRQNGKGEENRLRVSRPQQSNHKISCTQTVVGSGVALGCVWLGELRELMIEAADDTEGWQMAEKVRLGQVAHALPH